MYDHVWNKAPPFFSLGAIPYWEQRKYSSLFPTRRRELQQKYTFEQWLVCPTGAAVCLPFLPSGLGGEHSARILRVVSAGPGDCGFAARLQQHPAQGLIQQLGHPHALLRATDILFALL